MSKRSNGETGNKTPEERLREAITALDEGHDAGMPTATALCEYANVSRTALYRYHPDILKRLHELQRQRRHVPSLNHQAMEQLRKENLLFRKQLEELATLVDHYFSAWQEASSLLQRRERELAEQRKSAKVKIAPFSKRNTN